MDSSLVKAFLRSAFALQDSKAGVDGRQLAMYCSDTQAGRDVLSEAWAIGRCIFEDRGAGPAAPSRGGAWEMPAETGRAEAAVPSIYTLNAAYEKVKRRV